MSDDPDDRAWELAEQFDDAARSDGAGPGPALTAAVAATCDDEIQLTLLESLEALAAEDLPAAVRYETHLLALAALLPDVDARSVRAAADLLLAEAVAMADDWTNAYLRLVRVDRNVDELIPEARPDWEWIMGGYELHAENGDGARRHCRRARELFAADERWFKAAVASEALALLHGEGAPGVEVDAEQGLADWAEAADHYAAAEVPDQVQEAITHAYALLRETILGMRDNDGARIFRLAVAVREPALRHGAVEIAAKTASFAGGAAVDAGRSLDEAHALFAVARAELRTLDESAEVRIELAEVDYFEARVFQSCGRFREMEPLLHAAIRVFRAEGRDAQAASCETMLTAALSVVEQDLQRVSTVLDNQRWEDAESHAGVAMLRGFTHLQAGRIAEAIAALTEASELSSAGAAPWKAVGFRAMAAVAALYAADTRPARLSVAEIDRYLADDPTVSVEGVRLLSGMRLVLLIELTGGYRDWGAQLTHLVQVEELLLSFGAGLMAAMFALRRARTLLALGEHRAALEVGLPAILALDAVRFTLPDAHRRRRWARAATEGFDTAFRAAASCRETGLLAELLEVVRGNAVPLPRAGAGPGDDITESLGALLDASAPSAADVRVPVGVLDAAELLGGGENRTALGLPPYVRTPWNTVALAEPLRRARRYHDPVRADVVVTWHIGPGR